MKMDVLKDFISEWSEELSFSLMNNNSFCLALFSNDKKLIFANDVMISLFKEDSYLSFVNPTFDQLLSMDRSKTLIFEGYITIGNHSSVNTSVWAKVYFKNDKLLLLGGVDVLQLSIQNKILHQLNSDVISLQRQLIFEKETLAKTLLELDATNKSLELLNVSKDKFFSIIAHDLKSPFNSIIGFSQLLEESVQEKDFENVELFSKIILQSSNRAMDLLSNLMQWAQSQTGRIEYKPTSVNLISIINEIGNLFKPIAEQKSIAIISELPSEIDSFCDENMIKTVLRNIISNAIKFSKPGGVIKITAIDLKNGIKVSVSDSGIGIPEDRIGNLFKIDENYSTEGTLNEQGTGLGLILCKEFIEKHGGEIWVESELGVGSTFSFTIPHLK